MKAGILKEVLAFSVILPSTKTAKDKKYFKQQAQAG